MILLFVASAAILLCIDIVAHRKPQAISLQSAIVWSLFYVACAFAFAGALFVVEGSESATLFLTGWALEKMLAFDNLVVFAAIFAYFNIPDKYQHKVLHWGILGAVVFRLIFVFIGVGSLALIGPKMEIVFALVIAYTAYLMLKKNDDVETLYIHAWYLKPFRKRIWYNNKTDQFIVKERIWLDGKTGKLDLVGPEKAKWCVTPLLLALITIEVSDILFSSDSVPAVIAVTKEPLLIYSAMIFAILGLRSLYFVLSALMRYLVYLEQAVIVVLFFISLKLLASALFDIHIPPLVALSLTLAILSAGILASLTKEKASCS